MNTCGRAGRDTRRRNDEEEREREKAVNYEWDAEKKRRNGKITQEEKKR